MRNPADVLVDSAVHAVDVSGIAESIARMATVTEVGTDGTITVSLDGGDVPKVRLLSTLYSPTIGDSVEVMKTSGGWVCLGPIRTHPAPAIQAGTVTVNTSSSSGWVWAAVTFPRPFPSAPTVVATVNGSFASATVFCAVRNVTATGFQAGAMRQSELSTNVNWIAYRQ